MSKTGAVKISRSVIDGCRIGIAQLIGEKVVLTRVSGGFVGYCPFHKDRNGRSLFVNPEKQFYYCSACNQSGDAIHFVQRDRGLDFVKAVEFLIKRNQEPPPRLRLVASDRGPSNEADIAKSLRPVKPASPRNG